MSRRNERATLASVALEGRNGWDRDPYASGAVPEWDRRFPNLPIVADGREVTEFTRAGRGTTAFDLFRTIKGFRVDMLSVKTEGIEDSGKLPSKLSLSTGNVETLGALIDGINNGAALATIVFASRTDENGEPERDGLAIFIDLATEIRKGVKTAPDGGFCKGQAPGVYFKWSSARKCGAKHKAQARADLSFPYLDDKGRLWKAPDRVCYRELVISLSALGYKRANWIPCNVKDLAAIVERQNWSKMAFGDASIG